MSTFVPQGFICCENCMKVFCKYAEITNIIDTDIPGELSNSALSGLINKIRCPYCDKKFTYETPLLMYSSKLNVFVYASCKDADAKPNSFKNAAKICDATNYIMRLCTFAMDAAEKMRIFYDGLNDAAIEILKQEFFPEYKEMDLTEEYVVYDKTVEDFLQFSMRDDLDNIKEIRSVHISSYNSLMSDILNIPTGDWIRINRDWAIKYLEEIK